MSEAVLSLKDYGVADGDKTILNSVTLDIPDKGILNILGPTIADRESLTNVLSGANDFNQNVRIWGEAIYLGEVLGKAGYPVVARQNERLAASNVLENIIFDIPEKDDMSVVQQCGLACRLLELAQLNELIDQLDVNVADLPVGIMHHLAILRACAANPQAILIDDPMLDVEDENSIKLVNYIKEESQKRAVIIVAHNHAQAHFWGGQSVLLAGGRVQEYTPTKEFFASPKSPAAIEFVKHGTCSELLLDNELEKNDLNPVDEQMSALEGVEQFKNNEHFPEEFLWLKEDRLAGMPKPGSTTELKLDLEALQRAGVTHLVSLTAEIKPVDEYELAEHFISSSWVPFEDMGAPSMDQAIQLCEDIDQIISDKCAVAIHCKSGLGRTCTVFAFYLIWEGLSLSQALETIQKIEPRWVQSEKQNLFLEEFANDIADRNFFAMAAGN